MLEALANIAVAIALWSMLLPDIVYGIKALRNKGDE